MYAANRAFAVLLMSTALLWAPGRAAVAAPADGDTWAPYRFLIGDWVGEGSGKPGEGSGRFSLVPELHGSVLVRRNTSVYPASGGRPALVHEDLMIIYHGEPGGADKANYFDSEGHVIEYSVVAAPAVLVFTSAPSASAPRYRLSYGRGKGETVTIKFEIAPPGMPGAFKTYLDGAVRRAPSSLPAGK